MHYHIVVLSLLAAQITEMNQTFEKDPHGKQLPADVTDGTVEETSLEDEDDAVLRANGHEAVMPRQFNWISALGLGFSITNSWIGYLVRTFGYSEWCFC